MTATKTSTMPITEMPKAMVEAELIEVRRLIGDREHAHYSNPSTLDRLDPAARTAWNVEGVALLDRQAVLERRLAVIARQAATDEEQPTRPESATTVALLPSGIDPAFIPADLQRRYQDCVLAVSEKRSGSVARLTKIEAELVEVDAAARREAAAQAARQRRTAEEQAAQAKIEEGEAEKLRLDAVARLETSKRTMRKLCMELADAYAETCQLGVTAVNQSMAGECAAELVRAVQARVPLPHSRRIISALGSGWTTPRRPVRIG